MMDNDISQTVRFYAAVMANKAYSRKDLELILKTVISTAQNGTCRTLADAQCYIDELTLPPSIPGVKPL